MFDLSDAMKSFVQESSQFPAPSDSLPARRAAFTRLCRHFTPACPDTIRFHDVTSTRLRLRVYRPTAEPPRGGWPTLLYLHGGGWNMGSLDTHDWFAFALLRRAPLAVVAVDYRLAPEAPFPAAADDTLQAYLALRAGTVNDSLSCERVAVCGDSAGGNLAASLCMAIRAQGGVQPVAQALLMPVVTARTDQPSMHACADAPLLTAAGLAESIETYVPLKAQRDDPLAMPLAATRFDGLAPAFIALAQFDPLRDQGRAYAHVLRTAGNPVIEYFGAGLVHGSLRGTGLAEVDAVYDALAAFLRTLA